jgi:CHAT domain-containing protein/tetratricopeptide (TPR) repeat protein
MERLVRRTGITRTCSTLGWLWLGVLIAGAPPTSGQTSAGSDARLDTVRAQIHEGRYEQAEVDAEDLLTTSDREQLAGSIAIARADLLVEALVLNGRGAEPRTRALAEQVLRARTAQVGPHDPTLAVSVRNLGDVLVQAGDYKSAIAQCKRAVQIRETALGSDAPDVADDFDHLALALAWAERYDDALAAANRALIIKEKTLDGTDVRIGQTLKIQGWMLQRKADYGRARAALERALALREAAGPAHPETAAVLRLLGDQCWLEGNFADAKQFAARAVSVAEQTLRPNHPDLAAYLRSLALPTADLGDLAGAHTLRARALAIAEQSLGPDHPWVAGELNDLAMSFGLEREHARARNLFERALKIYERRLGPNHSGVITAVFNLALVSEQLGDFREARRYFNRVIASWTRSRGPSDPWVASAVSALARMLTEQGQYGEARVLYERALAIWELKHGKQHREIARTLVKLSACLAKLGQTQRAYDLSTRALNIWQQAGVGDTLGVADALKEHGELQATRGDYEGARTSYERALSILTRILGPAHPDLGEIQVSLSAAFAGGGQSSEALRTALEADAIVRDHLRLTLRYLPERQALGFVARRPRGLDMALSIADADGSATALVLDRVMRGRALILDEMAARQRGARDASRPDLAPLWATFIAARQRLANLVVRGPNEQRPGQYLVLLDNAHRDKEVAERALAEKSATFNAELTQTETGLDRVRAALPPDSALVSFVRYDRTAIRASSPSVSHATLSSGRAPASRTRPSYVAFVLRSGDASPIAVTLGGAETIDRLIAQWRHEVIAGVTLEPASERAARNAGKTLRQRIWDPIATYVRDVHRVFVVPDGAMNLVPLAALPVGQSSYLLEQGPMLHYLSAERDLVSAADASTVGQGLLALGGPSFNDRTLFAARSPSVSSTMTRTPLRGAPAACETLQSVRFPPLPASASEANEVVRLWTEFGPATTAGGSPRVLVGKDASESTFKREAPGSRILHLATHGFFLGPTCESALEGTRGVGGLAGPRRPAARPTTGENPFLLSGLAMAGANRRTAANASEDDGILTAEEVATLNLAGVEWAVLSACDTGLGEVKVGEGVFGLRRAFQIAGARTIIMSLWAIEDAAARQWMRALYRSRLQSHLDTADAMQAASLSVLHDRRAKGQSTHPFFWAGFVAAGDWR